MHEVLFPIRSHHGFVLPAAIFLLVALGGLAGWMMQLTQTTHAQDALTIESARAYQAAEAGLEAGIYAARQTGASCADVEQDFTLAGQLARFTVSVSCVESTAEEVATTITFFEITSIACNQPASGACPNPTPTLPEYAERQMRATVESGL